MPGGRPRWTDEARQDLAAILDYIATDNPAAADTLLDRILIKSDSLPENPRSGRPGRLPGTRELVIHPSYILIYADTADQITILRLLHSARIWP